MSYVRRILAESFGAAGNWLCPLASSVRQVLGVPDYDRYVAHVRAHHPECEPLAWGAFYRARLAERYDKPGAKCC